MGDIGRKTVLFEQLARVGKALASGTRLNCGTCWRKQSGRSTRSPPRPG